MMCSPHAPVAYLGTPESVRWQSEGEVHSREGKGWGVGWREWVSEDKVPAGSYS